MKYGPTRSIFHYGAVVVAVLGFVEEDVWVEDAVVITKGGLAATTETARETLLVFPETSVAEYVKI